jgi:MFS transporter, SP family, arabinose:H+ symporter
MMTLLVADAAVERTQGEGMKSSAYLLKTIIVGALGGLLFGFDTAVIAGTTHMLTTTYGLSAGQLGFTVSAALWGTVIGAMFAGIPGEKWGGRETLRGTALLYLVSALGCALAWNWPSLVVFRFIGGLGIGASSVVGPVYLAEMAPAKSRGRLVGIFQINIVIGILLAYLSNYLISLGGIGASEWRWQFGVAAVPAFMFFVMLFGIPQSPRWLVTQKGKVDEARRVLEALGNPDGKAELQEIVESARQTSGEGDEALFTWKYRVPIFLAVSVAFFNQTAGINAILYYLSDIFMKAGFSQVSGNLQAVAVGLMNLLATLLAMTVIDKLGRKTLLLIGSVGMAGCLFSVAAIFYMGLHQERLIYLLVAYIAFFAISQGAVIWVFISEVFPNRVRAKGQSLGSSTHWVMNAIISFAFPLLAVKSGAYPFMFFGVMMVVQFFVVLLAYPETKGVTLERMQAKLGIE